MNKSQRQSLRTRIGKIIAMFSILLVFYYTSNLALLYNWGLGEATHGIVLQEAALFLKDYAKDKNTPLPVTRSLRGYIGSDSLPDEIKEQFPPEQWERWPRATDGILYRFVKNPGSETHHHLLMPHQFPQFRVILLLLLLLLTVSR